MGSGVSRVVTGSYVGTGSALEIRTVGFRPRKVETFNVDGLAIGVWTDSMADAAALKVFNHADTQIAFITSAGITPLSDGFGVGTDADLNTATEVVHYVVYE